MADEQNKTDDKSVRLEVRSRSDRGFRREGRLWTPDPVEDSFTEEAAQRLLAEPQLIVRKLSGGSNLPADTQQATAQGATGATGATGGAIPTGSPHIADYQPSGVRSGTTPVGGHATDVAPFGATGSDAPHPSEPHQAPARRK